MGFALTDLTEDAQAERLRKRFMRKVIVGPGDCWSWTGCLDPKGYGRFHTRGTGRLAHRVAYELFVGPIPSGLTLDHTCHSSAVSVCSGGASCVHRSCVNPEHLEAITQRENILRGRIVNHPTLTHCPQNHPYDDKNTYWRETPNGTPTRHCRICSRASGARYRARRRSALIERLSALEERVGADLGAVGGG
jgi:hypothetical protein